MMPCEWTAIVGVREEEEDHAKEEDVGSAG
jgi:hypothetical protein